MKRAITFNISLLYILGVLLSPIGISAQRRARPGSMRHTEEEIREVQKKTKVSAKYIHDNSRFAGPVKAENGGACIKIGNSHLYFNQGRYVFGFEAAEFNMRDAKTKYDLKREGITQYEYDHSWKNEKIGNDFSVSGKYEIVHQYDTTNLVLYVGDTDEVFTKIPLVDPDAASFSFINSGLTFEMKLQ